MRINSFGKNIFVFNKILKLVDRVLPSMRITIIVTSFVIAFCDIIQIALIAPVIAQLINPSNYSPSLILPFNQEEQLYFIISVILFSLLCRLTAIYFQNKSTERLRTNLSSYIFNTYLNVPYFCRNNFSQSSASSLTLAENDRLIIHTLKPLALAFSSIIVSLGTLFYLLFLFPYATIILLIVVVAIYLLLQLFIDPYIKKYGRLSSEFNEKRFHYANESLRLYQDIKAYHTEDYFWKRYKKIANYFSETLAKYQTLSLVYKYFLESLALIGIVLSVIIIKDSDVNSLLLGEIATFAFAAYKLQPSLTSVAVSVNSISYGSPIIERIEEIVRMSNSNKDKINNNSLVKNSLNRNFILSTKNIVYLHDSSNIMTQIPDFLVPRKGLIALTGPSGSGKSTCLDIISGFSLPSSGILNYSPDFRPAKDCILLTQNSSLIKGTFLENIVFGFEHTRPDAKYAAECLINSHYIDTIEEAYSLLNVSIQESATNISGGQSQRLLLARALYRKPKLLLLDEPTSSLDPPLASSLMDTLYKISESISIVIVTHNPDLLLRSTPIISFK